MVTVLYSQTPGASELNSFKIVEFLGGSAQLTRAENAASATGNCWIVSADTLLRETGIRALLRREGRRTFVCGFRPERADGELLHDLTGGAMRAVEAAPGTLRQFQVAAGAREICRQFTGLRFDSAARDPDSLFVEGQPQDRCSVLIRTGEKPSLVAVKGEGQILLCGHKIANLDRTMASPESILDFFGGLAPLMMFLRTAIGGELWENDHPRACFMLDDPLLKRKYGFLDYYKLLETMQRERFCTSMAFIPWNFRRSKRDVTRLFAEHSQRYSICVHGCDHTQGEYGIGNYEMLRRKSRLALERMKEHQRVSGIPFDEVMVFPQGIFSTAAMKAVKDCGYIAAVNSAPYTTDSSELTLRDLLEPAVTRLCNFPLFIRRSPDRVAEAAFDLFLGKPAILVEHHGYFRNGYGALAELVRQVNALDARLEWTNLANICAQTCLKKRSANGAVQAQFFTDRFVITNDGRTQDYMLVRRAWPDGSHVRATVDGRPLEVLQKAGWLRMDVSLGSGQTAQVQIEREAPNDSPAPIGRSRLYEGKVLIRRALCEFRDNYVDRSQWLSRYASALHRFFFQKHREC